jgi:hypothetical protein
MLTIFNSAIIFIFTSLDVFFPYFISYQLWSFIECIHSRHEFSVGNDIQETPFLKLTATLTKR